MALASFAPSLFSLTLLQVAMCFALLAFFLFLHSRRRSGDPQAPTLSLVINLAHRPERLASFVNSYKGSDLGGVPLRRVDAVDGRTIDWSRFLAPEALERLVTMKRNGYREGHPDLTPGAVGCYLSHVDAWREIASSGAPYGLVFEDDTILSTPVRPALKHAMQEAPSDWDIILLGYQGTGMMESNHLIRISQFLGLWAYAVSARAAERMCTRVFPIRQQLDWEITHLISSEKLKVYGVHPMTLKLKMWPTDIQSPLAPSENPGAPVASA